MHRDELSVSSATVLITGPNLADALAARSSCSRRLRTPSVRVHQRAHPAAPTAVELLPEDQCSPCRARPPSRFEGKLRRVGVKKRLVQVRFKVRTSFANSPLAWRTGACRNGQGPEVEEARDDQVCAPPHSQAPSRRAQLSTLFSIHRGSSITSSAQKAKPSWEKRLQERAELKSVQAAQNAITDTIIAEKRVRRRGRCCGAGPHGSHALLPGRCTGSAGGEGSEDSKKEGERAEGCIVPSGALVQRLCLHPGRPVGGAAC